MDLDASTVALATKGQYMSTYRLSEGFAGPCGSTSSMSRSRFRAYRQELVEPTPFLFISRVYLQHLRQQLSRNARRGNFVMDWDPEEGFESAFEVFTSADLHVAAKALFYAMCPGGPGTLWWTPPPFGPDGPEAELYSYVTYTVLFLAVQQFAENLRQSTNFKMRTWQYLAASFPNFDPQQVRAGGGLGAGGPRCAPASFMRMK